MTFALVLFSVGAILLIAGKRGQSIGDVLRGALAPDTPQTPGEDAALQAKLTDPVTQAVGGVVGGALSATGQDAAGLFAPGGGWGGAQAVVNIAMAIGKRNHLHVISTKRATRNTASGGVSDHYVGCKKCFAADQSNGGNPTPEMDQTAREIADTFHLPWSGSGVVNGEFKAPNGQTYRVQMLYRTNVGGNHYNHVHFGARLIGYTP